VAFLTSYREYIPGWNQLRLMTPAIEDRGDENNGPGSDSVARAKAMSAIEHLRGMSVEQLRAMDAGALAEFRDLSVTWAAMAAKEGRRRKADGGGSYGELGNVFAGSRKENNDPAAAAKQ
jgi:hypothetical protein